MGNNIKTYYINFIFVDDAITLYTEARNLREAKQNAQHIKRMSGYTRCQTVVRLYRD